MTVVKSIIELAPTGTTVTARLIAVSTWTDHHSDYVTTSSTVTDSGGAWQLNLPPQSTFEDVSTCWLFQYLDRARLAVIPAGAGPFWLDDIEVSGPSLLPATTPDPIYLLRAERGATNGVAALDETGKVPADQLPGSSGGSPDWADITGKPSTFPPTLPIAQSGVTNLTADLASLVSAVGTKADAVAVSAALATKQDAATAATDAELAAAVAALTALISGRAAKPVVRRARVTSGSGSGDVPPDTAGGWAEFTPTGSLVIPAAIGDHIRFHAAFATLPSDNTFWDVAVKNGSLVEYLSSGSASPLVEGDPALAPFGGVRPFGFFGWLDVTADHLSGGNVVFVMAVKSNNTGKILLNTNDPFRWHAVNLGPVS